MSDHVNCPHGYMRRGWCYRCNADSHHPGRVWRNLPTREQRVMDWLDRHDRAITLAIGVPVMLGLLWVVVRVTA